MPSLLVTFEPYVQPLRVPLACQQMLQALIYHLLASDPAFSDHLHNQGESFHNRTYKLFTFGRLRGNRTLEGKQLSFEGETTLEIRALDAALLQRVERELKLREVVLLNGQPLLVRNTAITLRTFIRPAVTAHMVTPLCVVRKTDEAGAIQCLTPQDEAFFPLLQTNYEHKWAAAYPGRDAPPLSIRAEESAEWRKCVTAIKGSYLTAWYGKLELSGAVEALQMLYDVGLGVKNAAGFGMFEVFERKIGGRTPGEASGDPDEA